MQYEEIIKKLSNIEIEFINKIKNIRDERIYIERLGGKEVENMRAAEFLVNKGLGNLNFDVITFIDITEKGNDAKINGLPEEKLLKILKEKGEVLDKDFPFKDELGIAIGQLKKLGCLNIEKTQKGLKFSLTHEPKILERRLLDKTFPLKYDELNDLEKELTKRLIKRGLLKEIKKKFWWFKPNEHLKTIISHLKNIDLIEDVTPEIIEKGLWKEKQFRHYDLVSSMPQISIARKHFLTEIIEEIRKIWLEMGFEEMEGDYIQPSFWNLDALFVPQDHPARSLQDSIFIKDKNKNVFAKKGIDDKQLMKKIKEIHEHGGDSGSIGWQEGWDEELAKELMLRTHTTVLSAKTLYRLKKQGIKEGKFFAIGKVFRNETLDWKHLFEFHQVEGIVVGNVNFGHLIYYIKEFYRKLGFENVRIIPSYYPYTEPSADVEVFVKERNEWMELGGSGMFRPEVVKPLIGNVNVLAWGMGLERIAMMKYGFKDIRQIYTHDLNFLMKRPFK